MNFKKLICPSSVSSPKCVSLALLVIRLMTGVGLMVHGFGKIQAPFGWMGPEAPVPGILQALAALSEFGGGLALVLGLLTPLASLGIMVTMAVAVFFHINKGDGFVQGFELALVYFSMALAVFLAGPGQHSLDAKIWKK